MRVRVVMKQIVSHRLHHRARNLRAAGSIEIGNGIAIVNSFESGKLLSNLSDAIAIASVSLAIMRGRRCRVGPHRCAKPESHS